MGEWSRSGRRRCGDRLHAGRSRVAAMRGMRGVRRVRGVGGVRGVRGHARGPGFV